MIRSVAAVGLLLALVVPVSAQPPAPPPALPPQPVPPQIGPQPIRPPVVPQIVNGAPGVITQGGTTRASGASAPRLVVAKVVDGALVYSSKEMAPATRQMDFTVIENGVPVTRKTNISTMQETAREVSVPLDGLKIRDATGKRIQPLSLEIRLGKGAGVVLHSGPLPPEVRALLKDDAILVELPPGQGGFAQPVFAQPQFLPPGAGATFDFLQPLPAVPLTRPAPAPPTAPRP
jgi:hypothetical protein